jgi:large subunit ribosomal protein L14
MIYKQTILSSVDNSGIKKVKCLKIIKKLSKYGTIGDTILFSIKKKKIIQLKKKMYYGVILQTKKKRARKDGSFILFKKNSVLPFDEKNKIIGTRLKSIVPIELQFLKNKNLIFKKTLSLAKETI